MARSENQGRRLNEMTVWSWWLSLLRIRKKEADSIWELGNLHFRTVGLLGAFKCWLRSSRLQLCSLRGSFSYLLLWLHIKKKILPQIVKNKMNEYQLIFKAKSSTQYSELSKSKSFRKRFLCLFVFLFWKKLSY